MKSTTVLGRSVRVGLISQGSPADFLSKLQSSTSRFDGASLSIDTNANAALESIETRGSYWSVFNYCAGAEVLTGQEYLGAVRGLLDSGVDLILCLAPLQEHELGIHGANSYLSSLAVPVIVSDHAAHVDAAAWSHDAVMVQAAADLGRDTSVWDSAPNRCAVGGCNSQHEVAAGVVAGVAVAALERGTPRAELLDSLHAWAVQRSARLVG